MQGRATSPSASTRRSARTQPRRPEEALDRPPRPCPPRRRPRHPGDAHRGTRWFDRFLRGDTAAQLSRPVAVAPERWRGRPRRFAEAPEGGRPQAGGVRPLRSPPGGHRPVRPLSLPPASQDARGGGLRLAHRRGDRDDVGRVVAHRGRARRARPPAGRSSSRAAASRRGRARTYGSRSPTRATFLPRTSRLADDRLLVARPERRQPPLSRPAVPVDRQAPRDLGQAADPRAADPDLRMRRLLALALAALVTTGVAAAGALEEPGVSGTTVRLLGGTVPLSGRRRRSAPSARARSLLRLRQLEGRRQRQEDRVPLLRRRLQPGPEPCS